MRIHQKCHRTNFRHDTITDLCPRALQPSMSQVRKPRIALEPNALQALKIWAALEYEDPSVLAGKIILTHAPSKVRELITPMPSKAKELVTPVPLEVNDIAPPVPSEGKGAIDVTPTPRKRHGGKRPLPDEMKAKILELWDDGKSGKSHRAIAKELGLNQSTISKFLAKKKEESWKG